MNWLNLETSSIRHPNYIGSEPIARATWLNITVYCCEQENGGRIKGARGWKDRQWQQTCGVTLDEVEAAAPLITWDGVDLVVWNYPDDKEYEVQQKRALGKVKTERKAEAARQNGSLGGRPKNPDNLNNPTETQREETQLTQRKPIQGKGREEERNEKEENPPGARELVILPTLDQAMTYAPSAGVLPEAAEAWWYGCDSRGVSPSGRFIDRDGREIRNWHSSLTKFGRSWQANDRRKFATGQRQPKIEGAPKLPIAPDAGKTIQDMFAEGRAQREREEAIAAGEELP